MGLVVGDALGVPFEFKQRDAFTCKDMVGYGTYYQHPGTWSDDSSMVLATMAAIIEKKGIDLYKIMDNFYGWCFHGCFTPYGICFDIGHTTAKAIEKYGQGLSIEEWGGKDIHDNGNGSLMRILPLAFMKCHIDDVYAVSALTHSHPISMEGCYLYWVIAKHLLKGTPISEILSWDDLSRNEYSNIKNLKKMPRDEIRSSGYVVDTLEAALWCLLHSNSYKECVLTAVNLGGDTDTVAAIAGGLAGIIYGVGGRKGIPKKWIKQIAKNKDIKNLCKEFEKAVRRNEISTYLS